MRLVDHVIELASATHPARLALTIGEETYSFGAVQAKVNRMARALSGIGIRRGDLLLSNLDISIEMIALNFAASRLGAVFVPTSPRSSVEELGSAADYLQPRLLVVDGPRREIGDAVARGHGIALATIGARHASHAGIDLDHAIDHAGDAPLDLARADPQDPQVMYLTSGSTGKPKAVVVGQHANWLRSFGGSTYGSVSGGRGIACMFPLAHMAGWMMITAAWTSRRAVHMTHSTDGEELLSLVDRWQAADLYCIPAVWRRVLDARKGDGRSLRVAATGTSYVSPELIDELRARFPGALNSIGYGSTEMGSVMTLAHDDILDRPGSVGLPVPGMEACLIDGELCLRASTMMAGYHALPDVTAEVIRDGWYHSGDLAEQDEEGFFHITGRRREIIRSAGESIAPVEVEVALAGLDTVAELAIVGLPHADWGEVICAAVGPHSGRPLPSVEDIRARLIALAPFKHPRIVASVSHIPRTPVTGQVQRAALRDMILQSAAQEPGRK